MLIAGDGVDHVSAPRNYDECFDKYRDYIVALVKKMGIDDSRAEDVTHDILMRFYQRDFLTKFDPDLVFTHHGEDHKARFKSFLTKFVITYLKGHRDKQRRLTSREVLIFDIPVRSQGGPGGFPGPSAMTWGEHNGAPSLSAEDTLLSGEYGVDEILAMLREHIAQVPRRSKFDTCDLVRLFDEVLRQIDENGEWDVNELRQIFGVSSTAMHSWMWWLRENIAVALDCRLPPKRSHRR